MINLKSKTKSVKTSSEMYFILTYVFLANILKLSYATKYFEVNSFYNNDNEFLEDTIIKDHRRVMRHTNIETVTENVLSRILRVIQQKYPNIRKTHDTAKFNKSMHSLKRKLQRYLKKKKIGATKSQNNVKSNKSTLTN